MLFGGTLGSSPPRPEPNPPKALNGCAAGASASPSPPGGSCGGTSGAGAGACSPPGPRGCTPLSPFSTALRVFIFDMPIARKLSSFSVESAAELV